MIGETVIKRTTVALLVLSSTPTGVMAQTPAAKPDCVPMGQLVALSGQRASTRPICPGERPALSPGQPYRFVCYSAAKIFNVIGAQGATLPGCTPPVTRPAPCVSDQQTNCIRKGPGEDLRGPVVILPYGRVLMETRPTLAWRSVPGATSYIARVNGPGVSWAQSTSSTRLTYPAGAEALQSSNVYTVTVIAQGEGNPSRIKTKALSVLPESSMQQVRSVEEQIRSWNLEPDAAAKILDGLYLGRGLLDQSIQILQERIQAGSLDPQLYQNLGDRYLEAGLLEEAGPLYSQARKMGQQRGDLSIVAQAQAGLEKIETLKASRRPK